MPILVFGINAKDPGKILQRAIVIARSQSQLSSRPRRAFRGASELPPGFSFSEALAFICTMCAWPLASGGRLELDPSYANLYPEELSESPNSPAPPGKTEAEGQPAYTWLPSTQQWQPAQAATEAVAVQQQQLDALQQQQEMQRQSEMQQQLEMQGQPLPQLPAPGQQHPAGSFMVPPAVAYSGREQQRLIAAAGASITPSHLQATGAGRRPMDPQHFRGSGPVALPAAQPGFTSSPAVPPQHPQPATPPRPLMRTALQTAATRLQSVMRVVLGPRAFNSIRSLMLRQHSAYKEQLLELHMLSQVQGLLMHELQMQAPVEGDGVFATKQQLLQQQHAQFWPSGWEVDYGYWEEEEEGEENWEGEEEFGGRGDPWMREELQGGAGAAGVGASPGDDAALHREVGEWAHSSFRWPPASCSSCRSHDPLCNGNAHGIPFHPVEHAPPLALQSPAYSLQRPASVPFLSPATVQPIPRLGFGAFKASEQCVSFLQHADPGAPSHGDGPACLLPCNRSHRRLLRAGSRRVSESAGSYPLELGVGVLEAWKR